MGSKVIDVPNVGSVEFPDSMSDDQISTAIKGTYFPSKPAAGSAQVAQTLLAHPMPTPQMKGLDRGVDTDPVNRFLTQSYANIGDAAPGIALAMTGPPAQVYNNFKQAYSDYQHRNDKPSYDSIVGKLGEAVGVNPANIRDAAARQDYAGLASEATVPIATTLLGGKLLGKAFEGSSGNLSPEARANAVRQLSDAVNVPPKQAPKFNSDLSTHIDKVVDYATENRIPLNSREGLASAMKGAASKQKATYYQQVLGPNRDIAVTPPDGYSGDISNPGEMYSRATLGQLDARLSQINAELSPKYAKGGMAAQAAVKSAAELNSEAAGIRAVLYGHLGDIVGSDPKGVGALRASFGALDDMAEKTGLSANKARYQANVQAQQPLTINPLANHKTFVGDKLINSIRGDKVAADIKAGAGRFRK